MSRWKKCTAFADRMTPVWVNLSNANFILPEGKGSRIGFGGEDTLDVMEKPDALVSSSSKRSKDAKRS